MRIFDWGKAAVLIAKLNVRSAAAVLMDRPEGIPDPHGDYIAAVYLNDDPAVMPWDADMQIRGTRRKQWPWLVVLTRLGPACEIPCWIPSHKAPAKWHGAVNWPADALSELNRLLGK